MGNELNRVLVITREIPPVGGGAGHVAINLAEKLAETGVGVDIVTMHFEGLDEEEVRGNIRIFRVNVGRKNIDSSYFLEMLKFIYQGGKKVDELVASNTYQVVHSHAIIPDALISLRVARRFKVANIVTTHGSDVPGYNPDNFELIHKLIRPAWLYVAKKVDSIVSPSSFLSSLVKNVLPDLETDIIPNGIDLETFDHNDISNDRRFLILSRLIKRKNYSLFLEALNDIEDSVTVDIVGDGPCLEELKCHANRMKQHTVTFHGWLQNKSREWRRLYEKARYFVFPSLQENFPIILLEAQLSRTVVVASEIPANREVLGNNGLFFDPESLDSMKKVIEEALSLDSNQYGNIVNDAHERVLRLFSWESVADRYKDLYLEKLAQKK